MIDDWDLNDWMVGGIQSLVPSSGLWPSVIRAVEWVELPRASARFSTQTTRDITRERKWWWGCSQNLELESYLKLLTSLACLPFIYIHSSLPWSCQKFRMSAGECQTSNRGDYDEVRIKSIREERSIAPRTRFEFMLCSISKEEIRYDQVSQS